MPGFFIPSSDVCDILGMSEEFDREDLCQGGGGVLGDIGEFLQEDVLDPIRETGESIVDHTEAELERFPGNIEEGLESVQEKASSSFRGGLRNIQETLSSVVSTIPGVEGLGGFLKIVGIGIVALIALRVLRGGGK